MTAVYREVLTQPSSTFTMVGSTPQPVSEPATLFFVGLGLVGLGAWTVRARKGRPPQA
jgi:hypothetical protein